MTQSKKSFEDAEKTLLNFQYTTIKGVFKRHDPVMTAIANSQLTLSSQPSLAAEVKVSSSDWIGIVEEHVQRLRFGSIGITVHEGRVVQIETSTKIRLEHKNREIS